MAASTDLSAAKKNLAEALGESMKLYLQILKSWFRQKISRDDFDHEARKLLPNDLVHLHNQFLLAIFSKCQMIGSALAPRDTNATIQIPANAPLKHKRHPDKKRAQCPRVTFHHKFTEANPLLQVAHIPPQIPEPDDKRPAYVSREMLLPDLGLIHGRMIVSAWDHGLEDVDDDAVKLLLQGVMTQLKNLLTAVLCRNNGYHLREKRLRCRFGTECPPSSLQNTSLVQPDYLQSESTSVSSKGVHMPTIRTSIETGHCDAAVQIATTGPSPKTRYPISLFDLYDALQIHKSALPSHSVYTITMERIANLLHHPSNEEETQDHIHRQEVNIKREIHAQQAVFRT